MKNKVENGEVIEAFEKIWKTTVTDYLYANDAFDLDLREGVAKDEIEAFITNALNQQRIQTIRDIRKWTKGKVVTKDKLREFLTKLEK